ncbi:hypothetical protein F4553_000977 [Allocatelliglobosispora scoriae]|uniref:DUF2975 domain-containing protein n=1 Tax=Allocatelliglobosispora scoriae TaxID=643052 RepID=A0A841BJT6_9ACTN|nr:DUF2975 domain-containing protein [Allocatelliglobosispora scoriae]MBB5867598.1 hypothetical protein [Allocatelliglobosispora scoriae]
METRGLGTWLRWLRGTATFVFIAVLCLAAAVLVITLIPGSPVILELPTGTLTGLRDVGGVEPGVVVDPDGWLVFSVTDPSPAQRLLYAVTIVPGLLLIGEIARRMATLLKAAQASDPFTERTARELTLIARITAFGGVGTWAASILAKWSLSATMLTSGAAVEASQSLVGWLAVAFILAAFGQLVARGVAMRTELDAVI